jgi:putative photosynthetic complex assembly protein 2
MHYFLPILYTFFLWWFTTGLIFALFDRPRWMMYGGFAFASGLVVAAAAVIISTRDLTDTRAVYAAITCGVVVWMWQTASYFLGFITGLEPPTAAPTNIWDRFRVALEASVYHEVVAALGAFGLLWLVGSAENRWSLWIYLALWLMHSSAKLNVFLGVRNFRIDFMPRHLHNLSNLIGTETFNLLLPFSILLPTSIGLTMIYRAVALDGGSGATVGYLITGTMVLLGALEHALLVIPLPVALWGWGVRSLEAVEG